ncbi:hypothetical protein [Allopusillimonas ginsengisoli]|uniref:hypothetical protein n=1 Tax=Allopusillimonas ginsengisoli TaxID=453575 RepID=UPI00142FDA09|nr:hypothetical protein [Allopusillimonas ginsengisoli]
MLSDLIEQHNPRPLAESDVTYHVGTVLHAIIVIFSLLFFAALAAASAEFVYTWALPID